LLSRFLGAVFLVLLGGLLLLDRALLRANRNQAQLDAQSAALLTEAFIASQNDLLDRAAILAAHGARGKDSLVLRPMVERLLSSSATARHLWVTNASGHLVLDLDASTRPALPPGLAARLHAIRPTEHATITVARGADGKRWILLARAAPSLPGVAGGGAAGLLVDGEALASLLARTRPDTRLSLAVLAGTDTVVLIGGLAHGREVLGDHESTTARLPNGGSWRVVATHAITSRSLRWGLWAFGVLGVLFLALGLLREQQRALQVADRSLELERLYSDVKRANQAKSEFLANVSHELRTPLNAIVGFVELLRDGFYGDLSPRQVPPVDRIAASATHLRHLVDQVLDIAKIAAGRLEVHPETIVLRPFVLNVASELESLVAEKGLAFSISVGASLPRVRTDPTHLRQILINLIGNAVKYTPAGTLSVRARLLGAPRDTNVRTTPVRYSTGTGDEAASAALLARAPRSGTWVALQVVDSGVGIAPADLERIFDEFEQVNAGPRGDSMQRGTGLGLAISRRLARLLGGEISVESELGRGSTFTVWLPVNPADLVRERSAAAAAVPTRTD
jgi:signal transduction histidine kinase